MFGRILSAVGLMNDPLSGLVLFADNLSSLQGKHRKSINRKLHIRNKNWFLLQSA